MSALANTYTEPPLVISTGKFGSPLRWLPTEHQAVATRTPTPSQDMTSIGTETLFGTGLRKVEGETAVLLPTPQLSDKISWPAPLPSSSSVRVPTANLPEADPWINPFADLKSEETWPTTQDEARGLSRMQTTEPHLPQEPQGISAGVGVRGNLRFTASPGRVAKRTDDAEGSDSLTVIIPSIAHEHIDRKEQVSPPWVLLAQNPAQLGELPSPPREIESTKPLEDQLAAGPMLGPNACPEPAGDERKLPQGLTPISSLSHQVPTGKGQLPQLCPMSTEKVLAPTDRGWTPMTFTWKASALCHKPAYFEQVQVERYGHSFGPILQPIISSAHFFATIPILPYKMGLYPANECIYTLGYYRPGSCAPYMLDPLPLSLRAALFQAGAWTAGVFVVP